MNVALWVAQVALAALFMWSGFAKSRMSKERLIASGQTGVEPFPLPVIRFTATIELVAAVGLIVPWWTGVAAVLTPLAALGLAVVMVGATWSHSKLHEGKNVAANTLIFATCLFVAVGRFGQLS